MLKYWFLVTFTLLSYSFSPLWADTAMVFIQGDLRFGETLRAFQSDVGYTRLTMDMQQKSLTDLVIVLITPGGSIYESIAIYDYINSLKPAYRIHTVGSGLCMSGGMIILQAGDVRYATEFTALMIHAPYLMLSKEMALRGKDARELEESLRKENQKLIQLFASRMKVEAPRISKYFTDVDYFMDAKTAYQIGFIDKVIYQPTSNWSIGLGIK